MKKVRVIVLIEILNLRLLFPLLFAIGKGEEWSTGSIVVYSNVGTLNQNMIAICLQC